MIREVIVDAVARHTRLYLRSVYGLEFQLPRLMRDIRALYDETVHSSACVTVFESAVADFIESKVRADKRKRTK